jgi:diguanylate cyclase (GGDEF)-like protein
VSDAAQPSPSQLVLSAAAHALARADSLEAGLAGLLAATAKAIGADGGAILAADPDRAGLVPIAAFGVEAGTARALAEAASGDHPAARAIARREITTEGTSTYAPLVIRRDGGHVGLGVLAIERPDAAPLSATERAILEAAADLIAATLDRSRMGSLAVERSEWFQRISHTDPLTGLANARTFSRVLELELARAGRQRGEVSVAVFDVDGLGRLNIEAGHDTGDDVLREVAAVLAESIRLVDTVARWGPDEFALVAPGSAGLTVARRVLDGIARVPSLAGRGITVSAGLARFPADGTTGEELLDAAARALGSAKAGGPASIAEAITG